MKRISNLRFFLSLLSILLFMQAAACPYHYTYFEKGGNVYWGDPTDMRTTSKLHQASIYGLDTLGGYYAKNRSWVYYTGKVVDGAHPESFEYIGYGYAKDRSRVFYNQNWIKGVKPKDFEIIRINISNSYQIMYGKDKENIIIHGKKTDFDYETFQVITTKEDKNYYYLDKNGIYYYSTETKLDGADPQNYKLEGIFLLSSGNVFFKGRNLNMDISSFKLLDTYMLEYLDYDFLYKTHRYLVKSYEYLIRDSNQICLAESKINLDTTNFCVLAHRLLRNKDGVYFISASYRAELNKIGLDPVAVKAYEWNDGHTHYILAKDASTAYCFNVKKNSYHKINLSNLETLKLKEKSFYGYTFTHKEGLFKLDNMGFRKLDTPK